MLGNPEQYYSRTVFHFYIMKLCCKVFVLYCRNSPKDDKFRYFGWLMARWKARVEFLLSVIELLFLSLAAVHRSDSKGDVIQQRSCSAY